MARYQVSVSAYRHFIVEADDKDEAVEKAKDEASPGHCWTINEVHPGAPIDHD